VRQGTANLPSFNSGKTLKPRSENPGSSWKRLLSKRIDKAPERVRRKISGCNESEHKGSLVKIETEMDETLFYERSQHH